MSHGCHECGCPNDCECPKTLIRRAEMWGPPYMRYKEAMDLKAIQEQQKTITRQIADNKAATYIALEARDELVSATSEFGPFHSAHEGFAVLKEEVDELWDEVKAKQGARDVAKMRKEAIQVAAMAMRFVLDVCDSEKGQV